MNSEYLYYPSLGKRFGEFSTKSFDSLKFSVIKDFISTNISKENLGCSVDGGKFQCWSKENIIVYRKCNRKVKISEKNDSIKIDILSLPEGKVREELINPELYYSIVVKK